MSFPSPTSMSSTSTKLLPVAKKAKTTKNCDDNDLKIKLYSYWRSSCSWRVRIGLHLKQLEYDYLPIHLVKKTVIPPPPCVEEDENNIVVGEQFTPMYSAKNPNQRVPTLEIDGHTLCQSMAILEYLDERKGSSSSYSRSSSSTTPMTDLLPRGKPYERAQIRNVCQLIGCDIQPVQNLAVLKKIMALIQDNNVSTEETAALTEMKTQAKMKWGQEIITRGFIAVEMTLKETAGTYCFNDQITMADCFLVPQVYNAERFSVDMTMFPTIVRVAANCDKLQAFQDAHPSKMPDAP